MLGFSRVFGIVLSGAGWSTEDRLFARFNNSIKNRTTGQEKRCVFASIHAGLVHIDPVVYIVDWPKIYNVENTTGSWTTEKFPKILEPFAKLGTFFLTTFPYWRDDFRITRRWRGRAASTGDDGVGT